MVQAGMRKAPLAVLFCVLGCEPRGDTRAETTPGTPKTPRATSSDNPPAGPGGVGDDAPDLEDAPLKATSIAVGPGTSYARMSDGTVRAWGDGERYALGRGDRGAVGHPMAVEGIEGATGIYAGGLDVATACATLNDGRTICWGDRAAFPLKREFNRDNDGVPPTEVPALAGARAISIGSAFGCAVMSDATVKCWGNVPGWPSIPVSQHRDPVPVPRLTGIVSVGTSWSHACALAERGRVACWGKNGSQQVVPTEGQAYRSEQPVILESIHGARSLAVSQHFNCATIEDGTLQCWGGGRGLVQISPGRVSPLAVDGSVARLSTAGVAAHICAVVANGEVRCAGYNRHGQLGVGDVRASNEMVAVPDLRGVVAVAASRTHTCALTEDGNVSCWGGNGKGNLGTGTFTDHITPQRVAHLLDAQLPAPAPPKLVETAPTESYEGIPEGCAHPPLELQIPGNDRTTFDVRFASASRDGNIIRVHLRDHGFNAKTTSTLEPPRGDRMSVEFVLTVEKIIQRRVPSRVTGDVEEVYVEQARKADEGVYQTFAAWLAADSPSPKRIVDIKARDAHGPVLLRTSPVRGDDVQEVRITHLDEHWVCGTLAMRSAKGTLAGDFAARVRE